MKGLLLIGKLSRQLGISQQTIRYYEQLGLIPQPYRAGNGYRVYSREHQERLTFIQKAKRLGLSLEEIKTLIDIGGQGSMPCEEVKRLLKTRLQELDSRIQNMVVFRQELAQRYQEFESRGAASGAVCGLIERQDS